MSNGLCNIAVGQYFFGNKGEKSCRGGKKITNNKKCKKACIALGLQVEWKTIEKKKVKDICFKNGHSGKWCKKMDKGGGDDFWICERGKIIAKIDVLNVINTAKLCSFYHFYKSKQFTN